MIPLRGGSRTSVNSLSSTKLLNFQLFYILVMQVISLHLQTSFYENSVWSVINVETV